jgi:NADPH:quinone reductase-like Zn-dependent oxidoreductase
LIVQPPSQIEAEKHGVNARMLITELSTDRLNAVARLVDAGEIRPCVARIYPMRDAPCAWRETFARQIKGKIVFMTETMHDSYSFETTASVALCAD